MSCRSPGPVAVLGIGGVVALAPGGRRVPGKRGVPGGRDVCEV